MEKGLDEYFDDFGEAAKSASEIARNLGLGAVGAIWIFKNPDTANKLLPTVLVWALLLAVVSLGIDLLHYVFKSIALYVFFKEKERLYDGGQLTKEAVEDLHAPPYIERVTWTLYSVKILALIGAYGLILRFLASKL